MINHIGPYMNYLNQNYPQFINRVFNNGLWYVSTNAKQDMIAGKAGDFIIPEPVKLEKKPDTRKLTSGYKKRGLKDQLLKDKKSKLLKELRSHNPKRYTTLLRFSRMTSYKKRGSAKNIDGDVGWIKSAGKAIAVGISYQTGGTTTVTDKMRRYFFAIGIGITKKTINRTPRDIWNNIHKKHVVGGGMQKHMENKLKDKIKEAEQKYK